MLYKKNKKLIIILFIILLLISIFMTILKNIDINSIKKINPDKVEDCPPGYDDVDDLCIPLR